MVGVIWYRFVRYSGTDSPILSCLMIFVFLGCAAIVLKGLMILQDNKYIRTVTAYSVFRGNERYTVIL